MNPEQIAYDSNGFPVLLADVAPAGVSKIDPNAKSGNPRHDVRSGKFSPGGGPKKRTDPPANVTRVDYARMTDAVREAARQIPDLDEAKLMAFIQKRAQNPAAVNIQAFMQMVSSQQMSDIVDVVAAQVGKVSGLKLTAPRGYLKKVLAGRSEDDIAEILERLQARGVDPEVANKFMFGRKAPKPKVEASDSAHLIDFEVLEFDEPESPPPAPEFPVEMANLIAENALKSVENFAKNVPQPIVNVHVPPPGPMKVTPVRDERGIILHTVQEPLQEDSDGR